MRHNVASLLRLMVVTDDRLVQGRDLLQLARAAQRGGMTALQVRLKHNTARELVERVRVLVAGLDVPVLVNDRPDIAIAAGAAGVHLGPDDIPVNLARAISPPGFIIGASVGTAAEAAPAAEADYWGVGPWRETTTKGDAGAALGADGFRQIVELARGKPCIAIGGIRTVDTGPVLSLGGAGVAVVSGILGASDIEAAAREYRASLLV
jgi:thiamine-phosphate pyrophosphorylase